MRCIPSVGAATRLTHLDEELEPLLGQPAHVQPGLVDKGDLQLLLQVPLLLGDLLQGVLEVASFASTWYNNFA